MWFMAGLCQEIEKNECVIAIRAFVIARSAAMKRSLCGLLRFARNDGCVSHREERSDEAIPQ